MPVSRGFGRELGRIYGKQANGVAGLIEQSAAQSGIPVSVFAGLLYQESGFNPKAVSSAGAKGIAQFMPGTAGSEQKFNPMDPSQAIPNSARHLRGLYDAVAKYKPPTENDRLALMLAAYNAGLGNVDSAVRRAGGSAWNLVSRHLPQETRNYVPAIAKHASRLGGQ